MPKTCIWPEGCTHNQFSKKLCLIHWRMEHGKPLRNNYQESDKPAKEIAPKKVYRVKAQTTEEAVIKVALSKVKQELRLKAIQDNEYYCQGCGKGKTDLQCSHILAVGDRKDLELEPDNIQLLCPKCHILWETKVPLEMSKLHCFESNLKYIKEKDPGAWQRLQTKIYYDEYFSEQKIRKEESANRTGTGPGRKVPGKKEKDPGDA